MSAPSVFVSQRRGACPGLSAPMQTGDGLLVRLLPVGTISLAAFAALCAAARQHGNGVIEITARGSIQVRGLGADSATRFADAIAALKVAADGIPVLCNPLAELDPEEIMDAATLAADVRSALATTPLVTQLAPKVSVAVDGNGQLTLDDVAADVRLSAGRLDGRVALQVAVGGGGADATPLGFVGPASAVEVATQLLKVIARRGRVARARDVLAAHGIAPFRAAIGHLLVADTLPPLPRRPSEPIGLHRLRDGSLACGIGLAFGHADAAALERLTETAAVHGASGMQTAPGRVLMTTGLGQSAISSLRATAKKLGFIVDADDPRRHIFACPGAPTCSSAYIAARGMAPRIAEITAPHLNASFQIHVSGCVKGCAHPRAAALTVVGAINGCELVANGSAGDVPFATVASRELPAAITRYTNARQGEIAHEIAHV